MWLKKFRTLSKRDRQRQTETDRDRQRQTETDRDRQRQILVEREIINWNSKQFVNFKIQFTGEASEFYFAHVAEMMTDVENKKVEMSISG